MAGSIVGVDIGSVSVRAVEVRGYDTARPQIAHVAEVPLPMGSVRRGEVVEVATVSTALKRLWAAGSFGTKNVVLGMGGQRVFARDLSVARGTKQQIRESLPFVVQDLLPVPVQDALLDFYPIAEEQGENGPQVSGIVVAALKEAVNGNVTATLGAGLRPIQVDLIPFAISRALTPVRSARGRDVIVSVGANTTNVVVVSDGVPQFVRTMPNGGDDITRAIATKLQWSPDQAEAAKRAVGMGGGLMRAEDRPVLEVVYEVVGELLAGIRNTLSYYASSKPNAPVQRVLLSGGGAQLAGLPKALADLTGLPVALPDSSWPLPAGRGQGGRTAESAGMTTALGLALGSHA